jgi:hypothetical protein
VSTRRCAEPEKSDSAGISDERESRITVLAIEQALAKLGIHARLSNIVSKAPSTKELSNRVRAVSRSKCAE